MAGPLVQTGQRWRAPLLSMLLPLLAATEFVESGSFLFSASHIAQGLGAGPAAFAVLLASFATGSMVMVACQQHLARRFGYRAYLLGALALFQLGALGSLLARGTTGLLLARAVQGLGAGALFTSARILVVVLFAPAQRRAVLRHFISGLFGLSALGPVAAAGLLDRFGWQAVFAAPLPLALLCTVLVWAVLPPDAGRKVPRAAPARPWVPLAIILAVGLIQLGLAQARFPQAFAPRHLAGLLAAAVLLLWVCWWHQRDHAAPFLHWQGLRHPRYQQGLGLYGLYYVLNYAAGVVLPVYAEHGVGLGLWQVGLLASGGAWVTWLAALAYLRWGARSERKPVLMAWAAAIMAVACAVLAFHGAGLAGLWLAVAAKGVFSAWFVLPLAGLTFSQVHDDHFGAGYQAKNLLRHVSISVGMTLATLGLLGGLSTVLPALAAAAGLLTVLVLAQPALSR